jgi:alpha-1,2-mannosyltransferase
MGYAFTFPLVKLYADIPVGAYVHYPTISTDMLQRVKNRTSGHTNTSAVARSGLLSRAKLVCVLADPTSTSALTPRSYLRYYVIFAWLYAWCLWRADYIMVNSSWTQAHVNHLLRDDQKGHATAQPGILALRRKRAHIVYPPCDTKSLAVLPLENREELILSVAQFR